MPGGRLRVVVTRRLPPATEARLAALFDADLRPEDAQLPREGLVAAMARADVLVTTLTDRIDAAMLAEGAGRLGLIANYGAGLDHLDVGAASAQGVLVTSTPGVMTEDTADMAIALILAVARRIPEGLQVMQDGGWAGWAPLALLGQRVGGRKLGVLGMGRIGQAVARRARAFGMGIHYHNRRRLPPAVEDPLGATYWSSLDQMVARVDVLSINCPHTPATWHLLNDRRLRLMKPTAVIVNTSRGEVVDENALTRALREGRIAGAGLDVYERGRAINPRLRALPNVVLLPHMGSATVEGREEMGERVVANIEAFARGEAPPDLAAEG